MKDRAIVYVVNGGASQFQLYLPRYGTPDKIAQLFKIVLPPSSKDFRAGEVMADLIAAINPLTRSRLLSEAENRPDVDYKIEVWPRGYGYDYKVFCHEYVNGKYSKLFEGPITQFTDWTLNKTGWEHLITKVVQFKYSGGSEPGGMRTVRVEKAEKNGSRVQVEGLDLGVGDLKGAYRRYYSDKISEMKVLN